MKDYEEVDENGGVYVHERYCAKCSSIKQSNDQKLEIQFKYLKTVTNRITAVYNEEYLNK